MATRAQAFPSNYLGKDDVVQPIVVTIDHVSGEEVSGDNGKEPKRVAHFRESVKPLILNNGNWQTIEEISGQGDDDYWGGTKIEIFVDPSVQFGGKRVGGVRVRKPLAQAAPAQSGTGLASAAMAEAWAKFKTKHAGETTEVLGTLWRATLADFFPGKAKTDITFANWRRLIDSNFELPDVPVMDEPAMAGGAPVDDIPFHHGFSAVIL